MYSSSTPSVYGSLLPNEWSSTLPPGAKLLPVIVAGKMTFTAGKYLPLQRFFSVSSALGRTIVTTSNDPKEETMSKTIKTLAVAFAAAAFAAPLAQADAYRANDASRMNPLKMGDVSRMNPWASRNAIGRMVPKAHLRHVQRMLPWASRGAPVM